MLKRFEDLVGHRLNSVTVSDDRDELLFTLDNGAEYKLAHYQDCCEDVSIEDICGELDDLVGTPVITARKATNTGNDPDGSFTWTFYIISTMKGVVTIRWYGTSNGYYSEEVDWFCRNPAGVWDRLWLFEKPSEEE